MRDLGQKGKAGLPRTSPVLGVVLLSAWSPLVDKSLMLHLQMVSSTNRSFINAVTEAFPAKFVKVFLSRAASQVKLLCKQPLHLDPCLRIDVCKGKDTFAYIFIWRSEQYFKPEENSLCWFRWKWSQLWLVKVFSTLWEYITLIFRRNHRFCWIHAWEGKEWHQWAYDALGCSQFLPSLFHNFFFLLRKTIYKYICFK